MNFDKKLSEAELNKLEAFLLSEKTPNNCMSLDMLDGFLTCIAIGPVTMMPSIWLGEIWGEAEGDEMIWDSFEETQKITELILRHFNSIVDVFYKNENYFEPLLPEEPSGLTYISDWCSGFYYGIELNINDWIPLQEDEIEKDTLLPIILHSSAKGLEQLESDPKHKDIPNKVWVQYLVDSVLDIYKFWLPYRKRPPLPPQSEVSTLPKIGRNDPCMCGSGKKFKKCCLNKMPNS